MSPDHEVQDAPHLGPTAFLPGVMAIAPPQKKMQKIKKNDNFFLDSAALSASQPSTSGSESSEKIPMIFPTKQEPRICAEQPPDAIFSEKNVKKKKAHF